MRHLFVTAAAVAALAAPLSAQTTKMVGGDNPRPAIAVSVTPFGGYIHYGDYFETTNNLTYSNTDSYIVGGRADLRVRPRWALFASSGYGQSDWTWGNYFGTGRDLVLSKVRMWMWDGGLQYRFGSNPAGTESGFVPFIEGGVGAVGVYPRKDNVSPPNSINSTGHANFTYSAGIGGDIMMGGVGIRLMAKDYLSSLHWLDPQNKNEHGKKSVSNFALTAGLKIHLFDF